MKDQQATTPILKGEALYSSHTHTQYFFMTDEASCCNEIFQTMCYKNTHFY